jgi:hypothetical protein
MVACYLTPRPIVVLAETRSVGSEIETRSGVRRRLDLSSRLEAAPLCDRLLAGPRLSGFLARFDAPHMQRAPVGAAIHAWKSERIKSADSRPRPHLGKSQMTVSAQHVAAKFASVDCKRRD